MALEPQPVALPPDPDEAEKRRRQQAFGVLFASLLVVGFGNTMLYAILPPLARKIGLPDGYLGWIFSLSALIWVFSSPFWGRVSDRRGRKPIIALGLGAYAVSMAGIGIAASIGLAHWLPWLVVFAALVLARAIFGAFGSASNPAAQAYVADNSTPARRTGEIAALSSAFALGAAIGPGLCASLAAWIARAGADSLGAETAAGLGLLFPIFLTAAMATIASYAVARFLPGGGPPSTDAPAPTSSQTGLAQSWKLARDRRVAPYLIVGLGLSIVGGTLIQTFTFFTMDRLKVDEVLGAEYAGAALMTGAIATLAAQLGFLPRLNQTPRVLMLWGLTISGLGVAAQCLAGGLSALVFSQFLQGFGGGLSRAGYAGGASLAVDADEQGAVAGLGVSANGAGYVISPLTGGVLYQVAGPLAPLFFCLVLIVAMMVFIARSRRLAAVQPALTRADLE
jgi:MFS family permease